MKAIRPSVTTPDAYLASLRGWPHACVSALRAAVHRAEPALQEQLKRGHLVYTLNGPALLLRAEPTRVLFGFWRGQRLRAIEPRLVADGKYEMATLELRTDTPLRRATVAALVKEAARLNRELGDPSSAGRIETVEDYIRSFPADVQAALRAVRSTVREAAPDAAERLSYRMPALFQHGAVVYYGAFKQHIGLFPPVADPLLRKKLVRYAGPKGNLRLPLSEPMPVALIAEIVRARLKQNQAKASNRRGGTGCGFSGPDAQHGL
jgi:uncharacterized protein YdhG (YjbR/CyaY superfamily)